MIANQCEVKFKSFWRQFARAVLDRQQNCKCLCCSSYFCCCCHYFRKLLRRDVEMYGKITLNVDIEMNQVVSHDFIAQRSAIRTLN